MVGWSESSCVGRAELPTKKGYVSMDLVNRIMSVLNITFKGNYVSRAGVSFRRGTNASVMVGSVVYNNVYGIITNKISDAEMKGIANNIANIANIGKLISEEMKKTQVKPHGRWFVTSNTVRTQVKGKYGIHNVAYSKDTGKQIGELKRLLPSEVKPASIPALRIKKVVKRQEAAKAASKPQEKIEFDIVRFHKYIDLVASFRPTYKEVIKLKALKINTAEAIEAIDLDNPLKILTGLVHRARLYNKLTYKSSNEEEAQRIINKVNKIKEERKESADAGSSLPKDSNTKNKTELSMKGFELV